MTKPKVVYQVGNRQLVEYEDRGVSSRALVPLGVKLTKRVLRRGIAYGVTLDDVLEVFEEFSGEEVATRLLNGLHRRGVWARLDIERAGGARLLQEALLEAFGVYQVDLINLFIERG